MAPFEYTRTVSHPYTKTSTQHKHILPTQFRHPPFSAPAIPFRWVNTKTAWKLSEEFKLECNQDLEPDLGFDTTWVQDYRNQKPLLDYFFSYVKPEKSLCFFYAKQTPLSDDNRRVLIGVGRVLHVGNSEEYKNDGTKGLRCLIWDHSIQHSIRPDFKDGFILPYQAILAAAEKDESINPAGYVAYAPNDRHEEFSYATEHVTHDAAISALLSCANSLRKISEKVEGHFDGQFKWINDRLIELWTRRGPCPGLGAALSAFGVQQSYFVAEEIFSKIDENEDPWPLVNQVFCHPQLLSDEVSPQISLSLQLKWKNLPDQRKSLLKLLSRFELNSEQATRFYVKEDRNKSGIDCSDSDLLRNPYLLFELDRYSQSPISLATIDHGLFPDKIVRSKHPIPEPSLINDATDWRRVRALIVNTLENSALEGHTLLPQSQVINYIRDSDLDPICPIDEDLLAVLDDKFDPIVSLAKMKDGKRAYQLNRLSQMDSIIRKTVKKRIGGSRNSLAKGSLKVWSQMLNGELKEKGVQAADNQDEKHAREEKVAALKELGESRLSVLIGPAGTGKTKLVVSTLCHHPEINAGGILLLAPTGKARVKMQQATGLPAQTIAQFLRPSRRFDENTGIYKLSEAEPVEDYKTVVVDEASMLTEEMLAALFDSLTGVDRYVLVGDPRQLPPIGAGRPFVDIIALCTPQNIETTFPKVGSAYAELTVRRRQVGKRREDLELADWYSGRDLGPGGDEIFNDINGTNLLQHLSMSQWDTENEIFEKILEVLVKELNLVNSSDSIHFEVSLGGKQSGQYVYFNNGCSNWAEKWQILSPVKGNTYGVRDINRLVQKQFRSRTIDLAYDFRKKSIPKPLGPDRIVYGDKVINTFNHRRFSVWPKEDALQYVANGEIGTVVGKFRGKYDKWSGPLPVNVEFSSQPNFSYSFKGSDFGDEENPPLELAYAITVHKSQGSEFNICFLILPNHCKLLSRELLYTALTRQRDRLVILHQGNWSEFKKYSSETFSETARRYTNLFQDPDLVLVEDRFFEDSLIHRTRRGETVRSKSEVIIADNLDSEHIRYSYEKQFIGDDGLVRYPDFTIEDESGQLYLWEHLGMYYEENYRKKWKKKLEWYTSQGILPIEEGKGKRGILIVTKDTEKGGINSNEIKDLVNKTFNC